jgi:2-polyprenyl-3-methyl-5-hydroxy-6-metoxy-1,4-benzoquinol methylase
MPPGKPILVIASFEKGRGSGHLVRSGLLVRDLRRLGREAALYLPGLGNGRTEEEARAVISLSVENLDEVPLLKEETVLRRHWDLVVFDRFSTPKRELDLFHRRIPVIGIDEGGPQRPRFDFLLDLLPPLPSLSPPNALRPDLLRLPAVRKGRRGFSVPLKILVSFGGEDAAGLGQEAARSCAASGLAEVTLVAGALNGETAEGAGFLRVPYINNLPDHLGEYDLVVTQFGLCAFEALYAGVPVLLVSPGRLHGRLARKAGLVSAGRGKKAAARIRLLIFKDGRPDTDALEKLSRRCAGTARRYGLDAELGGRTTGTLAAYIDGLRPKALKLCPLCGGAGKAAVRFPDRTYRLCPRCGAFYMSRAVPPGIEYTEAYFFENYRKQYGKTYLEDFPNLAAQARRRLALIRNLLKGSLPAATEAPSGLLDIGCAYGAFLKAARDAGFRGCAGIDASAEAVKYVREDLGLNAVRGLFPGDPLPPVPRRFRVVTMWFVMEHFEDTKSVIEQVHGLLYPGGVLAFSTPSAAGISALLSRKKFLEKSPADHWTVLNARRIKKVLRRFGFVVKKVVVTGHHPERFPFCSRLSAGRGIVYKTVLALSRLFRLGDTFEVYAKKLP